MSGEQQRPRRRDEQALADRIARKFADAIPLAVLMLLQAEEEKMPGWVDAALSEANFDVIVRAFWAPFVRGFTAAIGRREAEKAAAADGEPK